MEFVKRIGMHYNKIAIKDVFFFLLCVVVWDIIIQKGVGLHGLL